MLGAVRFSVQDGGAGGGAAEATGGGALGTSDALGNGDGAGVELGHPARPATSATENVQRAPRSASIRPRYQLCYPYGHVAIARRRPCPHVS
jgi:hypothetical protein